MVRYVGKYACSDCGHQFIGMDVEWNATSTSYPVECPNCGSIHTAPYFSLLDIIRRLLKKG